MSKPTHHFTADGTKISIKDMCIEWHAIFIFMPIRKEGGVKYLLPLEKWREDRNAKSS